MHTPHLNHTLLILLSSYLLTSDANAETVYKSVDKDGKITYSSSPPDNHQESVKVDLLPPPSDDSIKAAQERHQQNLRADKMFDENRQKRSQITAEENRIKHERNKQFESTKKPEKTNEEGPYYGIPGHGILVLPAGPRISH